MTSLAEFMAFVANARLPQTAVILDLDGCLAPMARVHLDITVSNRMRLAVTRLRDTVGLVTVVTSRHPEDALRLVGVPGIQYLGHNGAARLSIENGRVEIHPQVERWTRIVGTFAMDAHERLARPLGMELDNRGAGYARFQFSHVADKEAARKAASAVAREAARLGLTAVRRSQSLDIEPPSGPTKGEAVHQLIAQSSCHFALYAGDSPADCNAFAALDELVDSGRLDMALRVAVISPETTASVRDWADVVLGSTRALEDLLDDLFRRR